MGHLPVYAAYRRQHPWAEDRMRQAGLIQGDAVTGGVQVSDDVLFSLRLTSDGPDPLTST
jgi:hypothetical protein